MMVLLCLKTGDVVYEAMPPIQTGRASCTSTCRLSLQQENFGKVVQSPTLRHRRFFLSQAGCFGRPQSEAPQQLCHQLPLLCSCHVCPPQAPVQGGFTIQPTEVVGWFVITWSPTGLAYAGKQVEVHASISICQWQNFCPYGHYLSKLSRSWCFVFALPRPFGPQEGSHTTCACHTATGPYLG